jgi:hypothetical protein
MIPKVLPKTHSSSFLASNDDDEAELYKVLKYTTLSKSTATSNII